MMAIERAKILVFFCILATYIGCLAEPGPEKWPAPSAPLPAEKVKAISFMLIHQHDPEVPEYHADEYRVTHWWAGENMPAGNFGYPIAGGFEADGLARVEAWKNGEWLSTRWIFIKFAEDGTPHSPWGIRFDLVPKEYQ